MAITRIEQRTQTDCMVACLAMILDLSYDTVAEWFASSHRCPNSLADAVLTLVKHGYTIQLFDSRGFELSNAAMKSVATCADVHKDKHRPRRSSRLTGVPEQPGRNV